MCSLNHAKPQMAQGLGCTLHFEGTRFQFPAPTKDVSLPAVTPTPGALLSPSEAHKH